MGYMKLSFYLLAMITISVASFATSSSPGDKIHFQDSSELGDLDTDKRPGPHHGNRNHRGRALGHQKQDNVPEFEQGIPGVYPIRGPPQAPLVLPSHPGRGVGVQNHKPQEPKQLPLGHHYLANPFLPKVETAPAPTTTSKFNAPISSDVTNQLPSSDKPLTTTPSYINPRRFDLFYGSNLLEEDAKRGSKTEGTTDVSFIDRGLFDTAPHCQPGQILVNNKCRLEV